jgi:hypothetical protein
MEIQEPKLFLGYFPLWGATFDSDEVGIVGNNVAAYIPTTDEWRHVQKGDVWMERFRYDPSSLEGPKPPLCLVTIENINKNENYNTYDLVRQFGNQMKHNAKDVVLALRLFKSGWFLDPELSEQVFKFQGFNVREVGPYRQVFLAGNQTDTPHGYELKVDEISRNKDETKHITQIWQLINQYRNKRTNTSADIAIENFHRSYGYQLSGIQRASFLFVAIDAILGGLSTRYIGQVSLQSKFRDRVSAGLTTLMQTNTVQKNFKPYTEADWLDTEGRNIRNSIAHGRSYAVAAHANDSYLRIQSIIRLLIRQFLEFSIKWAVNPLEISDLLDISSEIPPKAAYNKILDMYAQGVTDVYHFLQFDISLYKSA